MTTDADGSPTSLVAAATALERELEDNDRLVRALRNCALDSEKGIVRAADLARQTAESQAKVGEHVHALLAAIQVARERNLAAVEVANECVGRIDARSEELEGLLRRFAEIGGNARAINELAQGLRIGGAEGRAGAAPNDGAEGRAGAAPSDGDQSGADRQVRLEAVLERMRGVRDEAHALASLARDHGFGDIAGQANVLAQQIASLQNKLQLIADKLS
jgi:hypothetical protein